MRILTIYIGGVGRSLSANCGSMEGLGRCSRCHSAWFCSVKCQKAYWPFHREWCKKNDFADALEAEQPKFAKWMRKHGKIAVLKDGARRALDLALPPPPCSNHTPPCIGNTRSRLPPQPNAAPYASRPKECAVGALESMIHAVSIPMQTGPLQLLSVRCTYTLRTDGPIGLLASHTGTRRSLLADYGQMRWIG
jgi:hypothetical protein